MANRDKQGSAWPVTRLERVQPLARADAGAGERYEDADRRRSSTGQALLSLLSELRRRWLLASLAFLAILGPVIAYAVTAVPRYTSSGVLQVTAQGPALNPFVELTGGGRTEVETEVQILRRREFVLAVFRDLKLNLVDPLQPSSVTNDLSIALGGRSPIRPELVRARDALDLIEVAPDTFGSVPVAITAVDADTASVSIGENPAREYEIGLGETLEDESVSLRFQSMPVDVGETLELAVVGDGMLFETAGASLKVSGLGSSRKATNLVQIQFTHPDRRIAQAVVEGIMGRYLDQSLRWQALSASNSADFIEQRLSEAEAELKSDEEELRTFAEEEHAVQLDKQAELTITSTADLEAEKQQIELQEQVIGTVLNGMRRKKAGSASLTANFFDDPVLAANVSALTEAETEFSVLKATLTPEHPQVVALNEQIALRQQEVAKLLKSARRNLTTRRTEIDKKLEEAMGSLSAYPDKELELARRRRDVEVDQRLYSFLLEKFQEAEIMEASTTTDKRIVDAAALPHRKTSPSRGQLAITGTIGGLMFAFASVYLAHLLQRRLETVEAVKGAVPYPVYGTIPAIGGAGRKGRKASPARIAPSTVWEDNHGSIAEAFRALAVSVSLAPAVPGRGRIIQLTSSQPGEGKSTVIANLAVALAKTGARVLLVDLDLRKPVQHRSWAIRRSPGFSDLAAQAGGPDEARSMLQQSGDWGVDILTAGTKLPDTLGVLMDDLLESMLVHWSKRYDFVLLDSPPAFVADSSILARHVDLLLVVARPGVVERGNIRQAVDSLVRIEANKGLVLNAIERRHAEYYYGSGYYYSRSYGPSQDDEQPRATGS